MQIDIDKLALFHSLLSRDVHEHLDTDGRPVGEGRSEIYTQVDTAFKVCPYAGSRFQHEYPMNVSALNSILPEWKHTLLLMSWLGQRYRAFNHTEIDTHYDLARVSGTGVFLADYITLRRKNPLPSGDVPVILSGLYKVCLGFQHATFLSMMNDCFVSDAEKALPDAKGYYAWLEEHELLIGENEVCGGSEAMISRAYEAMRGYHDNPQRIEDELPQLAAMDIDWDAYDVFVANASELWRKAILFVIQMRDFGFRVDEPTLPAELRDGINNWLTTHFEQLLAQQSGLAVEIARFTLEDSGHSLAEWMSVQTDFRDELAPPDKTVKDSALVNELIAQVHKTFCVTGYEAVLAQAIQAQALRYEAFEGALLQTLNQHLSAMLEALGYEDSGTNITTAHLTAIYGKTIRDFG
ncbi:hypothetical protein [Thiothrix lacustris]|uniref:hypothetical protein n=1 Tax=Thiothrix lacustris TaxID=525917 RepID=UPI0027E4EC02|nr:hypothetical protein [Thiothrix lacustris]WMP19419.1 hypothetical protein RCS87_19790 [Thiothrix lacustris]